MLHNTDYIEKCFKQKFAELNLLQKIRVELEGPKDLPFFKYYIVLESLTIHYFVKQTKLSNAVIIEHVESNMIEYNGIRTQIL